MKRFRPIARLAFLLCCAGLAAGVPAAVSLSSHAAASSPTVHIKNVSAPVDPAGGPNDQSGAQNGPNDQTGADTKESGTKVAEPDTAGGPNDQSGTQNGPNDQSSGGPDTPETADSGGSAG